MVGNDGQRNCQLTGEKSHRDDGLVGRQRAEYLECAEKLQPFGAAIRDAVNFYVPHLRARNRTKTAAALVDELLTVKGSRRCERTLPRRFAYPPKPIRSRLRRETTFRDHIPADRRMVAEPFRQGNGKASLAGHAQQFPSRLNCGVQFRYGTRLLRGESGRAKRQSKRDRFSRWHSYGR
jgi:hypothetical protein